MMMCRTLVWTTWPSLSCAPPVPPTSSSWPSPVSALSPPPDQRLTSLSGKRVGANNSCPTLCTVVRGTFVNKPQSKEEEKICKDIMSPDFPRYPVQPLCSGKRLIHVFFFEFFVIEPFLKDLENRCSVLAFLLSVQKV